MIRFAAPAKINFYLDITGKRPDGYHTLSTVFQTIALADELTFEPASVLSLQCSDKTLPVDDRNIVMRAAQHLKEALRESRGAKIILKKIVPMGAGLGGGSADAAVTLRGLLRLWGRRWSENSLHELAVSLGADVPFFLKGGLCSASGIGDELEPMKPLPITWMVVVWPGFGVSTKEAYARVTLPFARRALILHPDPRKSLYNRFESLVFPAYPKLHQLKQELLKAGATASLMSGSGSAVYGLVKTESEGRKVLSALKGQYPHIWLTHTL